MYMHAYIYACTYICVCKLYALMSITGNQQGVLAQVAERGADNAKVVSSSLTHTIINYF